MPAFRPGYNLVIVALTSALGLGCGHAAGLPAMDLRAVEPENAAPTTNGEGAPVRAHEPERAPVEDKSQKSASLEVAGYTDSDHVSVFTPSINGRVENVIDGASLSGSYLVDVVSAASADIVSTASKRWQEVRHAGSIAGEYKPHELGVGFSSSVSSEPDYFSYGAAGRLSYDVNEKNTSLFFDYGYSHDEAGRHGTPFTVFSRTLKRGSFLLGLAQLIDASTIASLALTAIVESGDQSKPYRYIPMFTAAEAAKVPVGASATYVNEHRLFERPLEQLPLGRHRFAATGELAHRFDTSTARASERVYIDNWGVQASTTDARWFFDLGQRVRLWPHARAHVQSGAAFWQRAYVSDPTGWSLPEFRTGDRELGPLFSVTGGGGAKLFFGSTAHPHFFALGIEGDAIYTSYLDDLYITSRTGFLGTMTLGLGEEQ